MTLSQQGTAGNHVTEVQSQPVKALDSVALRFYQNDRLAIVKTTQGDQRLVWTNDSAVAQHDGDKDAKLLQPDLSGSILGIHLLRMAYSPYGFRANNAMQALLGFNGQPLEPLNNGYLLGNGYRLYSPTLMRFCSQDSLSPFDRGDLNAYAYCSGDPINNTDPSGHLKLPFIGRSPSKAIAHYTKKLARLEKIQSKYDRRITHYNYKISRLKADHRYWQNAAISDNSPDRDGNQPSHMASDLKHDIASNRFKLETQKTKQENITRKITANQLKLDESRIASRKETAKKQINNQVTHNNVVTLNYEELGELRELS